MIYICTTTLYNLFLNLLASIGDIQCRRFLLTFGLVALAPDTLSTVTNVATPEDGLIWSTPDAKLDHILEFDGDDDYVDLGLIEVGHPLQLRSGGTITTWFYQRNGDRYQRILDKSSSSVGTKGYSLVADPAQQVIWIDVSGVSYKSQVGVYKVNQWTHIAAVIGKAGFDIYINGVKVTGSFVWGSVRLPPNVAAPMRIGTWNHATGRGFNGFLKDLQIYNRRLSADEIKAVHDATNPNAALVAHYQLNEGDGCTATDKSSGDSKKKGVLRPDCFLASSDGPTWSTLRSPSGCALEFDGDDDHVDLGVIETDHPLQLSSGGTLTAWFNQRSGDRWQRIFDKSRNAVAAKGYALIANPVDRTISIAVSGALYVSVPGVYELNQWTHVAAVINKTIFRVYINGTKVNGSFRRKSAKLPSNVTTPMSIGTWNHSTGREFNGFLEDLRIYKRTLGAIEIKTIRDETKIITLTAANSPNQLPTARNDSATTQINAEISLNVLSNDNDADEDNLTIVDVTIPANGIAEFDDTMVYYTPNPGFTGTDQFDYIVDDGFGGTASAAVFITISSAGRSQCNDGIDNDGDGLVDWQYDLGCFGVTDDSEGSTEPVTQDNGWTVFETSNESLVIYVSNSEGNDNNDGRSPSTPVKTITKGASLVRDGHHDFLLLKRGDTWNSFGLRRFKSGKDRNHPMVIASYGNSSKRPHVKLLKAFINHGSKARSHIAIVGLSLIASGMDLRDHAFHGSSVVRGLRLVGGGSNILLEDNKFRYMQLTIQSHGGYQYKNISLRRNIVLDAWAPNSTNSKSGRASGLYASGIRNGLLIEENVFDHNGWNKEVADAGASMYGHNIYLQSGQDGKNTVVRGNIFTRAASHGLQGRSGGLFEDNLFVQNTYGLLIGGSKPLSAGTSAYARNNVILEGKRMDPNDDTIPQTAAVVGLGIGNTDAGTLKVEGNIVAHRIENGINKGIKNQPGAIYVDNIQYDWGGGLGDMNEPWPDPERSVGSYHAALGKKGALEAFLEVVRNRPLHQWPHEYTAYAVNDYIRAGFNR